MFSITDLKNVSGGTVLECSSKNGLLLVPSVIDGRPSQLLLDTGSQGGIVLDWSYASQVGIDILNRSKDSIRFNTNVPGDAGKARLSQIEVLGRTVENLVVSVEDLLTPNDPLRGQIAGYLGPKFVSNSLLLVNASNGVVGLFDTFDEWGSCRSKGILLRLLGQGKELPFTNDFEDVITPDAAPLTALLDTGSQVTIIAMNYVRRKKKHRVMRWLLERAYKNGRTVKWTFALPGDVGYETRAHLADLSSKYTSQTGVHNVDAIVGMDFFRHWIVLFNFAKQEVLLFKADIRRTEVSA
jgi:hypothetical protein